MTELLEGLSLITPEVFADERGFFFELYQKERYRALGIAVEFVQDNHSYSKKGVIRGMHFQEGQAKLVSCVKGRIFDVVVDIRKESPSFGKWVGMILEGEKRTQLFVPEGFAHGFAALSEEAYVVYKISTVYDKNKEKGFSYQDPHVDILWPIDNPILSKRDREAPSFREVV